MKKVIFGLVLLASMSSFADQLQIVQIPIASGEKVIEQLMDGRLVQFSCASAPTQTVAPACEASLPQCRVFPNYSQIKYGNNVESSYQIVGIDAWMRRAHELQSEGVCCGIVVRSNPNDLSQ